MVKLSKAQRVALKAVRDHVVTYHRNSLFANDGHRVMVDGQHQPIRFPVKYRTLEALGKRELVEMGAPVQITDAGRALVRR